MSFKSNIIYNHDFSNGLDSWNANCCDVFLVSEKPVVTNRNQHWQGLEQDVTGRVVVGSTYNIVARVSVSGVGLQGMADVIATLQLKYQNSKTKYLNITKTTVSKEKWKILEGSFVLSDKPNRIVFYLEGPPPGVNLLIESVYVFGDTLVDSSIPTMSFKSNIIQNHDFSNGLVSWHANWCDVFLVSEKPVVTNRNQHWQGLEQDITGRVVVGSTYNVVARVGVSGVRLQGKAGIIATLKLQYQNSQTKYLNITKTVVSNEKWEMLEGSFVLSDKPYRIVFFLEGPPPGVNLLIESVSVFGDVSLPFFPAPGPDILLDDLMVKYGDKIPPPFIQNLDYGVNIIANTNLSDGTKGWFPLGNCVLNVVTGSPHILPPAARDTVCHHEPLSGCCIHTTNRTQSWMGPAQMITDTVKPFVTYQVSAWVRLGPGATGPQNVSVALGVDSRWVNGGQVEVNDADQWHEVCGSFRVEKNPKKVMVYVQGPAAGISFMVAGLHIFAVDLQARFRHLNIQNEHA